VYQPIDCCLYYYIVTSQLEVSNKKPRFGPKVVTKEWWIQGSRIPLGSSTLNIELIFPSTS
jgi:hypothetical protein